MKTEIVRINPKEALPLIEELDAYQASLYPAESNHLDSIDVLCQGNVIMLGIRQEQEVIAMGAVKLFENYGEIKRVYVPLTLRRKGLAKKIMAALEKHIVERSIRFSRLETGILQHEAIKLYRRLGYRERSPFGDYRLDPLSVFMEKVLL